LTSTLAFRTIQFCVHTCCNKEKYFLNKKIHGHRGPGFFNKKLILDYYFCLSSGPVFLFQIFIIAPLPLSRDIQFINYWPRKYDRQNHVWSFMTKYLRFLCKFTSWSGETPTCNFRHVFFSWARIMSVLIGWPILCVISN
jgi:hypothetical protein